MSQDVLQQLAFHAHIRRWFKERFESPTDPQVQGWPSIAADRHTLIMASTGSGKTLAAFLWSINDLFQRAETSETAAFEQNRAGLHTLYISPLKALNNDIERNLRHPLREIRQYFEQAGQNVPEIRTAVRSGDTPQHLRRQMLEQPPHILITTPESLYLLLTSEKGRHLFCDVKYVIVDELHALCDNKRGVHLSLSLERLCRLTRNEPTRIGLSATQKPLERIAAYLGGYTVTGPAPGRRNARPVNIVDCGVGRPMDLQVIAPAESYEDLPDDSIWQSVYETLYDLIRQHTTTLVFTNMRAQTEKIARRLNELHRWRSKDTHGELALAHHGSISRERRYAIEERLKSGAIAAVITTASLELGIDIGAIDLVVHLEAPRSVAAGLQRIGRSGHTVEAVSKGRIIPLFRSDLDDALTIARAMTEHAIEETVIPENALDVLAQQILAETAMEEQSVDALYDWVRCSYCYRDLEKAQFTTVIEMVAGRFGDGPLPYLKARLSYDRVNQRLIARRGARLTAVMNGGTIPDRGYYGVYLKDQNIRLGEMEEEFVHEARVGETFYLGNSEWRIDSITHDRIIVTPVAAIRPKEPFWKGDVLYRAFSTSLRIAGFRDELYRQMERQSAERWLRERFPADEAIIAGTVSFFRRQKEATGASHTEDVLLAEWTVDHGQIPLLIIHAPFGARVTGLWAILLGAFIEERYRLSVHYAFDDDGIMLRLPDGFDESMLQALFEQSPEEAQTLIARSLIESPMFALHFRYNAARALLLPRSQAERRIPLWLQRIHAADLLQNVRSHQEFPLIVETYRNLLYDILDWPHLQYILQELKDGQRRVVSIRTNAPSPFSAPLRFKMEAGAIYETDRTRSAAGGDRAHEGWIQEVMEAGTIPDIIARETVDQMERRWQFLTPEHKARSAEDVYSIVEALGPIRTEALQKRVQVNVKPLLDRLQEAKRIVRLADPDYQWLTMEDYLHWQELSAGQQKRRRVHRFLQNRGPVTGAYLAQALQIGKEETQAILKQLREAGEVVSGKLTEDAEDTEWCARASFRQLYRASIAQRRRVGQPADIQTFLRFCGEWHGIGRPEQPLQAVLERFQGLAMPPYFLEREILRSRFSRGALDTAAFGEVLRQFYDCLQDELYFMIVGGDEHQTKPLVKLAPHGGGHLFKETMEESGNGVENDSERAALDFLRLHGASRGSDIMSGAGLRSSDLEKALHGLAIKGRVTTNDYRALKLALQPPEAIGAGGSGKWNGTIPGGMGIGRVQRRSRYRTEAAAGQRTVLQKARWMTTSAFAIMGNDSDTDARIETQARLLLNRYGVLVKEWYRREDGLSPYFPLFQTLKRLEWQGEIRRGYFVHGLSGLQFASPEALERLLVIMESDDPANGQVNMLSTLDPALPLGRGRFWNFSDSGGATLQLTRAASNHVYIVNGRLIAYSENYGRRLWFMQGFGIDWLPAMIEQLKNWLRLPADLRPRQKLTIASIDGQPAAHHTLHQTFLQAGFELSGRQLVLWPSAVLV